MGLIKNKIRVIILLLPLYYVPLYAGNCLRRDTVQPGQVTSSGVQQHPAQIAPAPGAQGHRVIPKASAGFPASRVAAAAHTSIAPSSGVPVQQPSIRSTVPDTRAGVVPPSRVVPAVAATLVAVSAVRAVAATAPTASAPSISTVYDPLHDPTFLWGAALFAVWCFWVLGEQKTSSDDAHKSGEQPVVVTLCCSRP